MAFRIGIILPTASACAGFLRRRGSLLRFGTDQDAKYVVLDSLCLSPQCGFASTHFGNRIGEDVQRRELELVVEVAPCEPVKSSLQMAALEHQVRFSKLHEKRADVITEDSTGRDHRDCGLRQ